MADLDLTEREDPKLQADPLLVFSDGRASFGQKLFTGIAAIVVVGGTLYGLTHQRGDAQRDKAILAVSGLVLPDR